MIKMRENVKGHYRITKDGRRKRISSYTRDITRTTTRTIPTEIDDRVIDELSDLMVDAQRSASSLNIADRELDRVKAEVKKSKDKGMTVAQLEGLNVRLRMQAGKVEKELKKLLDIQAKVRAIESVLSPKSRTRAFNRYTKKMDQLRVKGEVL